MESCPLLKLHTAQAAKRTCYPSCLIQEVGSGVLFLQGEGAQRKGRDASQVTELSKVNPTLNASNLAPDSGLGPLSCWRNLCGLDMPNCLNQLLLEPDLGGRQELSKQQD